MRVLFILIALIFTSCEKEYETPAISESESYRVKVDPRLGYIGTWSSSEYCSTSLTLIVDTTGSQDLLVNSILVLKPSGPNYIYRDSLNELILELDSNGLHTKYWSPSFTCSDYLR